MECSSRMGRAIRSRWTMRWRRCEAAGKKPIFGICLGHQIFGLALGGKTYKLKFGHHGGNHPIMNHRTGKVEITAQNHNFNVDPESCRNGCGATHTNLNDRETLAGCGTRRTRCSACSITRRQVPGPHDSHYLFKDFRKMMEGVEEVATKWRGSGRMHYFRRRLQEEAKKMNATQE
jgi:carbamoyl-phosphate synthase small subunit